MLPSASSDAVANAFRIASPVCAYTGTLQTLPRAYSSGQQSACRHALAQPIRLAFGDAELARDLVGVQALAQQRCHAVQVLLVDRSPIPLHAAFVAETEPRLDRFERWASQAARLLDVQLEAGALA